MLAVGYMLAMLSWDSWKHYILLLDSNAACRVDKVTASFAGMVDRVNCRKKQLLLKVRELDEVLLVSVGLDGGVLGDDTSTGARGIEKDSVKPTHHTGKLASIVVANDGVLTAILVTGMKMGIGEKLTLAPRR